MAVSVTNSSLDSLSTDLLRLSRNQVGVAAPVAPLDAVDPVGADAAGNGSARKKQQDQSQNEGQNLNSLVRPQASLSPSDELAVFASATTDASGATLVLPPVGNPPSLVKTTLTSLEASEQAQAKKDAHDALVQQQTAQHDNKNAAAAATTDAPATSPGAQAFAAYLYARNNDIVFNATPIAQIAA